MLFVTHFLHFFHEKRILFLPARSREERKIYILENAPIKHAERKKERAHMSSYPPPFQQEQRHFLSARDRRLLVFGYPRRVTSREVETLVRFLLEDEDEEQRGDERDPGDGKKNNTTTTIEVHDELDAHGCASAFVQLPRTTTREQRFRVLESKLQSGIQFEGANIYARAFDAPNRPEALKGLPRTVEEVFKKTREKKISDDGASVPLLLPPEGYTIGGSAAVGSGATGTKRKRVSPGPLLSLSENVAATAATIMTTTAVDSGVRLIRAGVRGGGTFVRDFDAIEFLEFDPATSSPGDCERESVKLIGRRGNTNVERKLAVVYAAEALTFFIGARGLAVRRMRNTFPTVAFECIEHPQRCVFLWQKGTGANGDDEVAKCEEILFEKAVLETIKTLQRTSEEFALSAKKVAAPASTASYDFRSQRSSEDTGFFRAQSDSLYHREQRQWEEGGMAFNDDDDGDLHAPSVAPFVDSKTPIPPPAANEYDHLYHNIDDKEEEEEEEKNDNTNRILDDDDFGEAGFDGGENDEDDNAGTYEEGEEGTNLLRNETPSPIEELQDADAAARDENNKDINSRLDIHRACSEKLISRTDVAFFLGSTNKHTDGSITERFDLNERFVRVRMPKGKTVSSSNYACGIITKAYGEPGRTKLHEITWKLVLDIGLASEPYTTDVAYLSNDTFTQTETSAFADNLKTRDGDDVAAETLFTPTI